MNTSSKEAKTKDFSTFEQALGQLHVNLLKDFVDDGYSIVIAMSRKGPGLVENAYALISINSPMSAFLKYDNHIEKDYSYKQTYHGAEVHQIDIDTSWYLRDLSEVDEFRHTLLIMRKKDLPVMESVIKEKRCEVKFEDLSNMDKGVAEVRMNIDSNLRMCYDRHAKVIKLVTEKIEL